MDIGNANITRQLFCAPEPFWQAVNTSDGLKLIYSKLDYAACTIHLERCLILEVDNDI